MEVKLWPTENYKVWNAECPLCGHKWPETTHDLWNVSALMCPNCKKMLGVGECDFHGDDNSRQQ